MSAVGTVLVMTPADPDAPFKEMDVLFPATFFSSRT
jgi:hypothetical protein